MPCWILRVQVFEDRAENIGLQIIDCKHSYAVITHSPDLEGSTRTVIEGCMEESNTKLKIVYRKSIPQHSPKLLVCHDTQGAYSHQGFTMQELKVYMHDHFSKTNYNLLSNNCYCVASQVLYFIGQGRLAKMVLARVPEQGLTVGFRGVKKLTGVMLKGAKTGTDFTANQGEKIANNVFGALKGFFN